MMYAPMNSRQRPVNNPRGEGAVTMGERPVYQPQPDRQPQENRQTPQQRPQAAQSPGNTMGMNQRQGNQMNPGMRQNRPMGNPGMGGMQQQGGGLLSKLLSIKDPIGSLNKIAAIMKLFG